MTDTPRATPSATEALQTLAAWLLENVTPLPQPVPFRGSQGLFDVPDELLAHTPAPAGPTHGDSE